MRVILVGSGTTRVRYSVPNEWTYSRCGGYIRVENAGVSDESVTLSLSVSGVVKFSGKRTGENVVFPLDGILTAIVGRSQHVHIDAAMTAHNGDTTFSFDVLRGAVADGVEMTLTGAGSGIPNFAEMPPVMPFYGNQPQTVQVLISSPSDTYTLGVGNSRIGNLTGNIMEFESTDYDDESGEVAIYDSDGAQVASVPIRAYPCATSGLFVKWFDASGLLRYYLFDSYQSSEEQKTDASVYRFDDLGRSVPFQLRTATLKVVASTGLIDNDMRTYVHGLHTGDSIEVRIDDTWRPCKITDTSIADNGKPLQNIDYTLTIDAPTL